MITDACETCANLREEEERMRAAYDVTVRSLGKYGDALTSEQIDATKKLADEMWNQLEAVTRKLTEHRRTHQAD